MKTKMILASLLLSGAAFAQTTPFVMTAPNEYRIVAASPNGKWACGVYADYSDERYAFLWNLESGEIELLNPSSPSVAYGVSNNGVVVGVYTDNNYRSNGASVSLAGYWDNHKWNRLELPESQVSDGGAAGISPDGHYITGNVVVNGEYLGYVWKDGKIFRELNGKNKIAMPYTVSPDGNYVGGWIQDKNRQACFWNAKGDFTTLTNVESPWSSARKFSPDGKTLLYFGGWQTEDELTDPNGKYGVWALYDMATGSKSPVFPIDDQSNFDFFDLSNKGTVMCENGDLGYVYQNGTGAYAYKYLQEKGIDLSKWHIFVDPDGSTDSDGNTLYQITRAATVSEDDNVMGFQYYNDDKDSDGNYSISMQSMVVKFNQPTTGLAPASIKAAQLNGLSGVKVSWKPNVAAEGITGYNVYRDGNKLNSALVSGENFLDANVSAGEHQYAVSAVYGSDESAKSETATVTVAAKTLSQPTSLLAQQHGYNTAYLQWSNPSTNYSELAYFNPEGAQIETFGLGYDGLSYETAIAFDATTVSAYKGQKLMSVGFYPLEEQGGWKINVYTRDANGDLQKLYTQDVTQKLTCGERNVVKLDAPLDMPEGELIIGAEVAVTTPSQSITALDYGRGVEGSSDLLRLTTEADFYSVGQLMQANNYLYEASWAMDATVAPANADLSADNVQSYNVYMDGKKLGSTASLKYLSENVAEGDHQFGVSAVYANGNESAQTVTTLAVTPDETQLQNVPGVAVAPATASAVNATWKAPVDRDRVNVQYCSGAASTQGVTAPAENNYGIQVSAIYPSKTFNGRIGYQITSARFYPLTDATYTIFVYKNSELVSQTEVDSYTKGEWNEVALAEPITIETGAQYQLVVDVYDATPKEPAIAVDNNNPVAGYSDIYSLDGESWNPISTAGIFANWMIGLGIENPNPTALPIDGYDVFVDNAKKNSELVKDTKYTYDFGSDDQQQHTIRVDVYYTVKSTSVKGGVTKFLIAVAGIAENTVGRVQMQQGNNELTVTGDNVTAVELVSAAGATVAKAKGNTVQLDAVAPGMYIVKAVVNGKTVTRKLMIEK